MTAALAISLAAIAALAASGMAGAWWAARKISQLGERVSQADRVAASAGLELETVKLERDRALFETRAAADELREKGIRIHALEEALADVMAEPTYSGLAPDDVTNRVRLRIQAARARAAGAAGAGGPLPAGASAGPVPVLPAAEGA